jgi:O-antigen/teichoic acid export membrane protein
MTTDYKKSSSLSKKTTRGVKWAASSQIGRQGMQFITTAILARLLSPSDFGLVGMTMVITGFVEIFKDLGTSEVIIQRQNASESLIASIFWLDMLLGSVVASALFIMAPFFAWLYREPRVIPLLRVLTLSIVISGLGLVFRAILSRDMAFDKLARIELSATIGGDLIGIGAAIWGAGVWSLVAQSLTMVSITTIMLWWNVHWKPRLVMDWMGIKSITNFSLNLTGSCILNYFARNADYFLIGRYLGTTPLGYYTMAYRLMLFPLQNVSSVITRVLFPAFSQIQNNNQRFRKGYLQSLGSIALVTFPMMLGLLAVSRPFVLAVLGPKWATVAILIIIFAPVGLIQSIGTTVGVIYKAKGRTDWMFRWEMVTAVLCVSSFVIGLHWGIIGVAAAYALVFLFILAYPTFAIPFRLIKLTVREMVLTLWPALEYSLIMLCVVGSLHFAWWWIGISNQWVILVSCVMLGIIVYAGLLWRARPPIMVNTLQAISGRLAPLKSAI